MVLRVWYPENLRDDKPEKQVRQISALEILRCENALEESW